MFTHSTLLKMGVVTIGVSYAAASWSAQDVEETAPREDRPNAVIADDETLGGLRPGYVLVMREGRYLNGARGSMHRDPGSNWWRFVLASEDPARPGHELTILPCTRLEEMQSQVESMPDQVVMFEVSGQILVFDNHNFLLPSLSPIVAYNAAADAGSAPPVETDMTPATDADTTGAPTGAPTGTRDPGRRIQEIERALIANVGEVKRSNDTGDPLATNRHTAEVIREATILIQRRGSISRTPGGAWSFVLDADAEGLEDPPLILLPCLLLHKIEEHTRRSGGHAPALISGRVFLYQGRNYLLPTTFRIPKERTKLNP